MQGLQHPRDFANEINRTMNIPHKGAKSKQPSFFRGMDTSGFREVLQDMERSQFISRFQWHNLPEGMRSENIERMLYFRAQVMFYLDTNLNQFVCLPFIMSSDSIPGLDEPEFGRSLDFIGQFRRIKPIAFVGDSTADTKAVEHGTLTPNQKNESVYLGTITKMQFMDVPNIAIMSPEQVENMVKHGAVVINDRTPGISQVLKPRSRMNEVFYQELCNVIVNVRSCMLNSTGFQLFALQNPELAQMMQMQLDAITEDRHRGQVSAAVSAELGDARNIQTNNPGSIMEFFNGMAQWDTLRLASMGIEAGANLSGQQYTNIAEVTLGTSATKAVYVNAFIERATSAAIINAVFGLNIYPDPALLTGMTFGLKTQQGAAQMVGQPAMVGQTEV